MSTESYTFPESIEHPAQTIARDQLTDAVKLAIGYLGIARISNARGQAIKIEQAYAVLKEVFSEQ